MSHDVFKCENCGARLPPPPATLKMLVCEFCKNSMLNPFYTETARAPAAWVPSAAASMNTPATLSAAPPGAAPAAVLSSGLASRQSPGVRTGDEIAKLAQVHLKIHESLFHAPSIPSAKEQGARKGYGELIPANEPILALYDSTLFGGADDGFVITPRRLGWKNIALDPRVAPWESLDVSSMKNTRDDIKFMGDVIQIGADLELQARLMSFLYAMAAPVFTGGEATRPSLVAPPPNQLAEPVEPVKKTRLAAREEGTVKAEVKSRVGAAALFSKGGGSDSAALGAVKAKLRAGRPDEEEVVEEEDEEGDRESWLEDTVEYAGEFFKNRDALFVHPNIPRAKERAARKAHAEEMEDDDDIVVIYDSTVFGGADDGFVVTPYGLFWKNIGADPGVAWWEDLDMESVEVRGGNVVIDEDEIEINGDEKGLARELYRMMQAMTVWAQGE